jgi:hypothetical protein
VQKVVPQLEGAVPVNRGQPRNEMFLECGNGAFGSIDMVVVGGDKVNVHFFGYDVGFHCFLSICCL